MYFTFCLVLSPNLVQVMGTPHLSEDALTEHDEIAQQASRTEPSLSEATGKADEKEMKHQGEGGQQAEEGTVLSQPLNKGGSNPSLRSITMMKQKISQWKGRQGSASGGSVNRKGIHPRVNLENTYKMLPDKESKFSVEKVKEVTIEAINFMMAKQSRYNPEKATQVSKLLADEIKGRVKKLGYSRYKIVVVVNIGETSRQGMEVTSRAVWDTSNDNCATVVHKMKNMFVVATVYGTYFE